MKFRHFETGAELTDDQGVITLSRVPAALKIRREESVLAPEAGNEFMVTNGYIQDFGIWLSHLEHRVEDDEAQDIPPESLFIEQNTTYERAAAILIAQTVDPSQAIQQLFEATETEDEPTDDLDTLVREAYDEVRTARSALEILVSSATASRLDARAINAGIEVPDGYRTLLLANHTKQTVQELLLIDADYFARIPLERARDLGAWIVAAQTELQKKSIWG